MESLQNPLEMDKDEPKTTSNPPIAPPTEPNKFVMAKIDMLREEREVEKEQLKEEKLKERFRLIDEYKKESKKLADM